MRQLFKFIESCVSTIRRREGRIEKRNEKEHPRETRAACGSKDCKKEMKTEKKGGRAVVSH